RRNSRLSRRPPASRRRWPQRCCVQMRDTFPWRPCRLCSAQSIAWKGTAMVETLHHWIGGERVKGAGAFGDVFNPATGELSVKVPLGDAAVIGRAVEAAQAAFAGWAATPPLLRARVLF